jgi:hypothetical protein
MFSFTKGNNRNSHIFQETLGNWCFENLKSSKLT